MRLPNSRIAALLLISLLVAVCAASLSAHAPVPQTSVPAKTQPAGPSTPPATPTAQAAPQAAQPASQAGQPASSNSSPSDPSPSQPGQSQSQNPGQTPANDQAGANDNSVFVFHAEVQNVIVHATVVDEKNHLVTNLDKAAFSIFENNQPQTIVSFRHEDVPVSMGIVIDNSGSMREKRDKVAKAAINLVRSSNPQDQVFVVNFNDEYYLDQPFTNNIDKLREALEKVESRGGTALYDAMVASADYMKKQSRLQKKVLFVVTDGEDNASRENLEESVKRLQEENGPTVYAIGLLGEEKAHRARRALETVAQRTGGIAFFPKTLDEVDEISRTVAHDIRNQYTLSYKPTTPKSVGGYRAIHVEAHSRGYGKLMVRTRSGYYPGRETTQ